MDKREAEEKTYIYICNGHHAMSGMNGEDMVAFYKEEDAIAWTEAKNDGLCYKSYSKLEVR